VIILVEVLKNIAGISWIDTRVDDYDFNIRQLQASFLEKNPSSSTSSSSNPTRSDYQPMVHGRTTATTARGEKMTVRDDQVDQDGDDDDNEDDEEEEDGDIDAT
jgi:hypothetical protein